MMVPFILMPQPARILALETLQPESFTSHDGVCTVVATIRGLAPACEKCGSRALRPYGFGLTKIKDVPVQRHQVLWRIQRARAHCHECGHITLSAIPGKADGACFSQRALAWAADQLVTGRMNRGQVSDALGCSPATITRLVMPLIKQQATA